MKIDHLHLSALLTVLREQSFEKAAQILCVTPSAISQRIRALEERMGALLIIRENPCRATAEGEKLYRHALQVELLEKDLSLELKGIEKIGSQRIPVAVNADSLATWFIDAMKIFYEETGSYIEVMIDDENHTDNWLKQGRVLGAVTSQSKTVQGCRIEKLGKMIYLPMASPSFMKTYFKNGLTKESFSIAPVLAFGTKDRIQNNFINMVLGRKVNLNPPCHIIPSSYGFQDAAVSGLGWGAGPKKLVQPFFDRGELVNMAQGVNKGKFVDVPLYWQSWRLSSPTLDALGHAIRKASRYCVD